MTVVTPVTAPLTEQEKADLLVQAKRKLAEAKTRVVYDQRFFGYGMLRSRWYWRWDMLDPVGNKPTMATDGVRKFVHPQFVLDHTVSQLAGTIMHEVDHDYLMHVFRIMELCDANKGRAPRKTLMTIGNVAADMIVNHHVSLANGDLPEWTVPGKENTTLDAEFYRLLSKYEEIKQEGEDGEGEPGEGPEPQQGGSQQGGGGGAGKSDPDDGGPPTPDTNASEDDMLRRLLQQEELEEALHGAVVEQMKDDGSKMSESEKRVEGTRMRGMIEQAMNEAKKAGQLPSGIEQFFQKRLKPLVPWQDVVQRFVGGFNREDFSYRRLSRRAGGTNAILPGLYNPEPAKLVFAPDTSGSMYGGPLERVGAELFAAAELYTSDPELLILWWDADVYPQTITDPAELKPVGGGGTSTAKLFDYIREECDDAQGVIVLTDGYLFSIGEPPNCDVLWIVVGNNDDFKPTFGEVAYYVKAGE